MGVAELKSLARERERGLRSNSRLRKAELIALLQNNPPPQPATRRPPRPTRLPPPLPRPLPSVRFRPRQPSPQKMNIFEQQEISKSRPVVTTKLNDWYDWLINHVPSTIKDGASRVFKTFKGKIMGFYNRVTGNQTQRKIEHVEHPASGEPRKSEPFNPREQAFEGAYRSYRIDGRPGMDVDTFCSRIKSELIGLIARELTTLNSARVQTTAWIRFVKEDALDPENAQVELVFNSKTTSAPRGDDLDQIVDGMIAHMETQMENPALLNSSNCIIGMGRH